MGNTEKPLSFEDWKKALYKEDIEHIEKELNVLGHDEGLYESEYREYYNKYYLPNFIPKSIKETPEETWNRILDENDRDHAWQYAELFLIERNKQIAPTDLEIRKVSEQIRNTDMNHIAGCIFGLKWMRKHFTE